ncbi:MAG: DEAD/DEAH box helicase [Anaerolineae bacterium]|nr:DEAD/DEAH box helicase [Anaerolineae bacterium]
MPATRQWFITTFGEPTPPQTAGWPPIQRGDHTLILSPTGSGKTLAAFLWGIDSIFRELSKSAGRQGDETTRQRGKEQESALRLVYVSPLKALNNDIERNLRVPLAGIRHAAHELGKPLPPLSVAVRTGDTPSSARAAMVRRPPHILITTPESLYLLLTSPVARAMFRGVRTVIVDEIHTLMGNKRGAHLALSLERLERLAGIPVQRIGLSATIRPLEEAAAFLGGQVWGEAPHLRHPFSGMGGETGMEARANVSLMPRPVTIVNAVHPKGLDLQVQTVVEDLSQLPGDSIWPSVISHLTQLIRQHRTTLIFCNSRRQAERTADRLNEQLVAEAEGRVPPSVSAMLLPHPKGGEITPGRGIFTAGASGPIRAHHGSMSCEARRQMEEQLKRGELPALVGTSSLELGIDIGAIDLVVQLGSPKSVSQGLQRVGRSGHLVGQTSVGRIIPLHREDLMEAAAIARGMLRGDVEPIYSPRNPLDVLAQQVVAMVAVETWRVDELYALVRQAYPYRDLSWQAFQATLEMLAGRYPSTVHRTLRPRLVWDRVHNTVSALPGSRLLALRNGGTIPDRGAYRVYLSDGRTQLGELDEEFVFETRPGDVFLFGSHTWRVLEITEDRVIVADAAGEVPRMPFWRGDFPWRPYALGRSVGAFRRELSEQIATASSVVHRPPLEPLMADGQRPVTANGPAEGGDWLDSYTEVATWLERECALDRNSARNLIAYVRHQLDVMGAISSDRTIIIESFEDAIGEPRIVIHSPFGGRVNGPWGLALASALRERINVEVEVQIGDDGILLRFPGADQPPPLDVIRGMTPAEARERILRELPHSAVFGAQFRQNAARALLLPALGGKRTPFWLQRLKAKDLLATVRQFHDFPIVAETYRDCLSDVMDLAGLEEVLGGIQSGHIRLITVETAVPSPVAASLLFEFMSVYMYEWDMPKAERELQRLTINRELLADLMGCPEMAQLLRPEAIVEVTARAQRTDPAFQARSADELALLLLEMGDLSEAEIATRSQPGWREWLDDLAAQGRVMPVDIPAGDGLARRWIASEAYPRYRDAFGLPEVPPMPLPGAWLGERWPAEQARRRILSDFLRHSGPLTREAILARYAFPSAWLDAALADMLARKEIVQGRFAAPAALGELANRRVGELAIGGQPSEIQFLDAENLASIHRRTLAILRREVQPVSLYAFADFLTRWQHLHPNHRLSGPEGLARILQQLRALPITGLAWESDVLPARLARYDPGELNALCQSGELIWVIAGGADPRRARVRFLFRGEGGAFLSELRDDLADLDEIAYRVLAFLREEGACFTADIEEALGLTEAQAEEALLALTMAGLVTNDSVQVLRAILTREPDESALRRPLSALEAELAAWRAQRRPVVSRPSPVAYRDAKRRVARRLGYGPKPSPPMQTGRWSPIHRMRVMGKPLSAEERAEQQARQLLLRWGVIARELVQAEGAGWEWEVLYTRLQLMEMRGEVRRGYFVAGLSGAQFALSEAIEQLRAAGDEAALPVVMSACDPANLFGSARLDVPEGEDAGERRSDIGPFARLPSTHVVLWRGQPALLSLGEGRSLRVNKALPEDILRRCLEALLAHLAARGGIATIARRVRVEQWNGEPVLGSLGQALLESLGFYRDPPGMTWEGFV